MVVRVDPTEKPYVGNTSGLCSGLARGIWLSAETSRASRAVLTYSRVLCPPRYYALAE